VKESKMSLASYYAIHLKRKNNKSPSKWIVISDLFLHFLQFVPWKERILVFLRITKSFKELMATKNAIKTLWKDCELRCSRLSAEQIPTISQYVTNVSMHHRASHHLRVPFEIHLQRWNLKNVHTIESEEELNLSTLDLPLLRAINVSDRTLSSLTPLFASKLETITVQGGDWLVDFSQFHSLVSLTLKYFYDVELCEFIFPPQLQILKLNQPELHFNLPNDAISFIPCLKLNEFWWEDSINAYPQCKWLWEKIPNLQNLHLDCYCSDSSFTNLSHPMYRDVIRWLSQNSQNRLHFEHDCQTYESKECSLGPLFAGVKSINYQEMEDFKYLQLIHWEESEIQQIMKWYKETSFCTKTIQFLFNRLRQK
jgi:hypothetical protein